MNAVVKVLGGIGFALGAAALTVLTILLAVLPYAIVTAVVVLVLRLLGVIG